MTRGEAAGREVILALLTMLLVLVASGATGSLPRDQHRLAFRGSLAVLTATTGVAPAPRSPTPHAGGGI